MEFLKNKSWYELAEIAEEATRLAVEQKATQPSYAQAIEAGIEHYKVVVKESHVYAFKGNVVIKNDAGLWRCIGIAETQERAGYIKFIKIS